MRAQRSSHRRPHALRRVVAALALPAAIAGVLAAAGQAGAADPLCAFQEGITVSGATVTAHVHVVRDGCQLSFVSIEKNADPSTESIYDQTTGVFAASDTRVLLTVKIPCGVQSETDLVLGPPSYYPPPGQDLGATHHYVDCPATGTGTTPAGGGAGAGGAGGGGGGAVTPAGGGDVAPAGGGGGGGSAYPDLVVTLSTDRSSVRVGEEITVTVTVAAKPGTGGSTGTHLLLTLPGNVTPLSIAQPGRGPGCTLTNVADCDLDWLSPPMTASMRVAVRVDSGMGVSFSARATQDQPDANPADNAATLVVPVTSAPGRTIATKRYFAFTAWLASGKREPGVLKVSMRLGLRATVMPKLVDHRGRVLATLRRVTLPAGVSSVRLVLPRRLAKPPRGTLLSLTAAGAHLRAQQLLRLP